MARIIILAWVLWLTPLVSLGTADSASIALEIDSLRANSALNEKQKENAIALLTEAQDFNARAEARAQAVTGFSDAAASAPGTLKEIVAELQRVQSLPEPTIPETGSIKDIDGQLNSLQAQWVEQEAAVNELKTRETDLLKRASDISSEVATVRAEVAELERATLAENPTDPLAQASQTNYEARLAERRAAISDLVAERASLPARQELVAARTMLASAKMARTAALVEMLQQRQGQSRVGQARTKLLEIEQAFARSFATDGLRRLAAENVNLARHQLELAESQATIAGDMPRLQQDLTRVTAAAQTVEQVLATGELNDDTAELLRTVRDRLPNPRHLATQLEKNNETIISIRLNRILWQDRLRNLSESEAAAKQFLLDYGDPEPLAEVLTTAIQLLETRKELLQSLINSARDTVELQGELRKLYEDLQARSVAQTSLLERHLLWLPTRIESGQTLLRNLYTNVAWLASPGGWYATASAALNGYLAFKPAAVALGLGALILLLMTPALRRELDALALVVGNVRHDTFYSTPLALLISMGLALPWALLTASIGVAAAAKSDSAFTYAISQGLMVAAATLFILNSFRAMARPDGVFHRHFRWSQESCRLLKFHLLWFTTVEVLVAFVFTAALVSGDSVIKYGIGRLAFIISSLAIARFSYEFLKPRTGIAASVLNAQRTRSSLKLLFVILVFAPLIVGVMPLFGYYEAAITLQSRIFQSGVILLLSGIIYSLFMRFSLIEQRRLAFKRSKELRRRIKSERQLEKDAEKSGEAAPRHLDKDIVDLETLSKESRRTLKIMVTVVLLIALGTVWRSLLPALGIADEVILWQGTSYVNGLPIVSGVSLWDLLVALLFIVGGFVLANNVRGMLELAVFERMDIDPGTRYAVITIAGYLLVGIGTIAGLGNLGVNWSSMQWIIAALGVGLGFGLQEIVANFVSGLIILFERPVRVGDIVTIGQLEGTVTSIKIRATRITDFDNREVLMPNKSIITENVTNWTLNDQVTRIILRIGVAYGSNVDAVRELILKVVSDHPVTLTNPAPAVFFMAHGDSSLNFEARVFVGTPSMRLPITHDLNRNINVALAEAGIEIPFPQRDVHFKTSLETAVLEEPTVENAKAKAPPTE